jgi:hypothetical protein
MTTPIPMPLRAAAGLAAVAIDGARRLPRQLVGLPVLAVGTALQVSLKAQQRYAELVARGDQLLGQLRSTQEGPPAWARFDDEVGPDGRAPSAFDAAEPVEPAEPAEPAVDVVDGAGPAADALGPVAGHDPITVATRDLDSPVLGSVPPIEATGPFDAGEPGWVGESGGVGESVEEEIGAVADDASRYDGYLAGPPLPGYEAMSIPQLRARLRTLSERQLVELVGYERATARRPPYLTMLENRLATVRGR